VLLDTASDYLVRPGAGSTGVWRPHAMVIHHVVFELGKTRGGTGLVLAYVHRRESFGATQQAVVQTAEDVTLVNQQQLFLLLIACLEITLHNNVSIATSNIRQN